MNLILNKVPTSNFKPSKIPGLVLWLDSSSLSSLSDSTPIDTWTDLSGQGNHATQGTTVNKPTKETVTNNGKSFSVARFDGVDDNLIINPNTGLNFEWSDPFTIFGVVKNTSSTNSFIFSKNENGGNYAGYVFLRLDFNDSLALSIQASGVNLTDVKAQNAFGANYTIVSAINEGTGLASGDHVFANGIDGTIIINDTLGGNSILNSVNPRVGSRDNAAVPWTGDISHVLIYNRALSTSERQRIERWLSKKTGVTLA